VSIKEVMMTEEYCDDYDGLETSDVEHIVPVCDHAWKFFNVGQGHYDNYICTQCHATMTKQWNETGTTTYKDRV
jgi:hypothetical protein